MSETPEEERPAATPPPEPAPAPPPSAPAPPPSQASRPTAPAAPVYQRRGFQLGAVGVIGLLLGGAIGLGIGLTAGIAFGHHDRPGVGHHQQWGPGDGYRQPDRKRLPDRPFAPPPRKQPTSVSPSPQAS